ncbi:MAG: hypothetical protein ABJA90_06645 [Ginsengibacter sp.]
MDKIKLFIAVFFIGLSLNSCHKKNYPARTPAIDNAVSTGNIRPDSAAVAKPTIKRKPKVAVAKVITVDDNAAHKSVDGRLYYDVLGHRYWKNYKDGKYYLYNKSMYNDPSFKAPNG